eukprot:symbB.v1.2.041206.t1/scaffold7924.1/size8667/1
MLYEQISRGEAVKLPKGATPEGYLTFRRELGASGLGLTEGSWISRVHVTGSRFFFFILPLNHGFQDPQMEGSDERSLSLQILSRCLGNLTPEVQPKAIAQLWTWFPEVLMRQPSPLLWEAGPWDV